MPYGFSFVSCAATLAIFSLPTCSQLLTDISTAAVSQPIASSTATTASGPIVSSAAVGGPNPVVKTTALNSTGVALQPVLPPSGTPSEFAVLSPSSNLTLWWGGVSNSSINKRSDSNNGILVNAAFEFSYPTVALDYAPSIANISCRGGTTLSGTFGSASMYAIAQQTWTSLTNVLLITSADGCGNDNNNDIFLAQKISFLNGSLSFTALGTEHSIQDVASKAVISWGSTNPAKLKKRDYKSDASEQTSDLVKRLCFSDCVYSESYGINLPYMLSDSPDWPVDASAPWPDAVLLFSYSSPASNDSNSEGSGGTEGGEESQDARRSEDYMTLAEREDGSNDGIISSSSLDLGLNLYCVDCGVQGNLELTGSITVDYNPFSSERGVNAASVSLTGNLYAGLLLGIDANVTYTHTWTDLLFYDVLDGFTIEDLVVVGLTTQVNAQATLLVEVEGQLLIGTSATWPNIDMTLDLLNYDSSSVSGLTPTFNNRLEAETEITVNMTLGLPASIGVGVQIPDTWSIQLALTETPSITAGASFTVSSDSDDAGDCPGIEYYLEFDNAVNFNVPGVNDYTISSYNDPLIQGCTAPSSTPPPVAGVNCTNGFPSGSPGNGSVCGMIGHHEPHVHLPMVGAPSHPGSAIECAASCVQTTGCVSLEYTNATSACHLFSDQVSELSIKPGKSDQQKHVFWDSICWTPCLLQATGP